AKYEIYKSKLELNKKEEQIKANEKQIKLQRFIIEFSIIVGILFFLLLTLLILLYLRIKKQKNDLLILKNLQRVLIDNLPIHIYLKDKDLKYQLVNKSYAQLLKYPMNEIIGKRDIELNKEWEKFESIDKQIISTNEPLKEFKEEHIDKDGNKTWFSITKVPYHDKKGNVIGVIGIVSDISTDVKLNVKLQQLLDDSIKQRKIISQKNKNITDSITYAKTIQDGILPPNNLLKKIFNEYFILYKPQGIVSGDFYYTSKNKDVLIFAVADCTGHGVPGAFLTMLSISFLNQIIFDAGNTVPSVILDKLNNKVKKTFENSEKQNISGLDIALCSVNKKTNILQFSGAFISLYILRKNEIKEYKPARIPLGTSYSTKKFPNVEIELKDGDVIYLFTDGYADQLGGGNMKKFSKRRLLEVIISNKNKSLEEQKQILEKALKEWQGNAPRFDDITIMAIKWKI
ncbi:MAG: SpoIIE family protein phosphatase, partial [Chlorobi bacterium]|nr:SpoIIE family protein phosphatase [Chlorobiota bacterium]